MSLFTKNKKGFTLVEIMIVVAILLVLFVVGIASYSSYMAKSISTRTVRQIGEMESAFYHLFSLEMYAEKWLTEDEVVSSGNSPTLDEIFDSGDVDLDGMLVRIPDALVGDGTWRYDADDDTFTCGSGSLSGGYNLNLRGVEQETNLRLNKIIDDDNDDMDCGRFREYSCSGTTCRFVYGLSANGSFDVSVDDFY